MVVPKWETLLKRWYGFSLPDDYLTFDLETTGFRSKTNHLEGYGSDVPVDFGWRIVRCREVIHRGHYLLDWTRYPEFIEREWLEEQLGRIAYHMGQQNKPWVYDVPKLEAEGKDPLWVLNFAYELFCANRDSGALFVGHNALAFDARMLTSTFEEFLGKEWEFGPEELIDTGSLEKVLGSMQSDDASQHFSPRLGEPMDTFLRRVSASPRKGITWKLEDCVERYQLVERHNLDPSMLHGADTDSHVCHLLLEDNRE